MYLNKPLYIIAKMISTVGIWFWGSICSLMILGFGFDILEGVFAEQDGEMVSIFVVLCMFYAVHFLAYRLLERAKMYDSFFATDPDGELALHVLANAMGIGKEQVHRELRILSVLSVFKLDIKTNGDFVMLTVHDMSKRMKYEDAICPSCGAVNRIRRGFVCTCSYCLSSFEEVGDVSE